MRKSMLALAAVSAFAVAPAQASIDIYSAALFGANECNAAFVCGLGDPDGWGSATVQINNVTNEVTWSVLANNILMPLSGAHIHFAAAGGNGPVRVDFGAQLAGSVVDADAAAITPLNAATRYVNLHNAVYPGGAIRGQLAYERTVSPPVPEPETYLMLLAGIGAIGMVIRRRQVR